MDVIEIRARLAQIREERAVAQTIQDLDELIWEDQELRDHLTRLIGRTITIPYPRYKGD